MRLVKSVFSKCSTLRKEIKILMTLKPKGVERRKPFYVKSVFPPKCRTLRTCTQAKPRFVCNFQNMIFNVNVKALQKASIERQRIFQVFKILRIPGLNIIIAVMQTIKYLRKNANET